MLKPVRLRVFALALALTSYAAGELRKPGEWRYSSPILSSQVRSFRQGEADTILTGFCQPPLRLAGKALTCDPRHLGSSFSDMDGRPFQPNGLIYGHFLAPDSDDVAISGSSAEGHVERWGGRFC